MWFNESTTCRLQSVWRSKTTAFIHIFIAGAQLRITNSAGHCAKCKTLWKIGEWQGTFQNVWFEDSIKYYNFYWMGTRTAKEF